MAVLKCKMCGGALDVTEGMTVCECEYCGTQQTITTAKDENLQALFNRANILRMKSEFDKAEQLYEKLVQNNPDDAEAHWGLILCKYGIEYVEDPGTFKRIPTCHRTSFDSIIADEDYKEALRCADMVQRGIYEAEAKEIDRLQKEILALSAKEDPYDVFICYKESDNGSRTPDSVIANDIYHQLTNEGFKVFYAAITLEDKLGSAYEPCIFAALNSAKVMLAIGTKPEYFTAVWVKNEWSRYLKMMKNDRSKLLIPCYKDMDAYELPEEFAHLQAQDMSKIGFINDIVCGIKKVIDKDEPKASAAKTQTAAVPVGNPTANSLIKRAFIFLEDGEWQSADEYCEKALDIDPENAQAYLGKLMAELKVRKREELKNCAQPFDGSNNFQKVVRYGNEQLRTGLLNSVHYIKERNEQTKLEDTYNGAVKLMNAAKSEAEYKSAEVAFMSILGYRDADEQLKVCQEKIEAIKVLKEAERIEREHKEKEKRSVVKKRKIVFTIVISTLLVCIAFVMILITGIIPESKYNKAMDLYNEEKYDEALSLFSEIKNYKDSSEMAVTIKNKIEYLKGKEYINEEQYANAITVFNEIFSFEDSKVLKLYCEACYEITQSEYLNAAEKLGKISEIEGYNDKLQKTKKTIYDHAKQLFDQKKYNDAKPYYENLGDFLDCQTMAQKCEEEDLDERKNKILTPFKNGEPDKAFAAFKESDFSLTTTYTQFMIDNGYQKEITEYLNDFQTYAGIYLDTEKTDTFTYEQKRRLEYLRDYLAVSKF